MLGLHVVFCFIVVKVVLLNGFHRTCYFFVILEIILCAVYRSATWIVKLLFFYLKYKKYIKIKYLQLSKKVYLFLTYILV